MTDTQKDQKAEWIRMEWKASQFKQTWPGAKRKFTYRGATMIVVRWKLKLGFVASASSESQVNSDSPYVDGRPVPCPTSLRWKCRATLSWRVCRLLRRSWHAESANIHETKLAEPANSIQSDLVPGHMCKTMLRIWQYVNIAQSDVV